MASILSRRSKLPGSMFADLTAKAAGMRVCGVFDESSAEYVEQMKAVCDFYIYDFNELLEIDYGT